MFRVQQRPCLWLTYKQVGLGQQRDIPCLRATFLRSQQVQTCYNLCQSSRGQRGHGVGDGAKPAEAGSWGARGKGRLGQGQVFRGICEWMAAIMGVCVPREATPCALCGAA